MDSDKKFDFVRVVVVDFHGRAKVKLIPAKKIPAFLKNGCETATGATAAGPDDSVPPCMSDVGGPNTIWRAEEDTIRPVPWAKTNFRIGELLCEGYHYGGGREVWGPRQVLRNQLQTLEELGFTIKSAFEYEFTLHDSQTLEPVFNRPSFASADVMTQYEDLLGTIATRIASYGVQVEKCEIEYAPGQFEMTFDPEFGMKTADDMFRLRSVIRETCKQTKNVQPTFMACPYFRKSSFNGCHLNFSIWSASKDQNVLYDKEKDELSDTGKYFIGGIIAHLDGIMSFLSPTVNCYRRIGAMAVSAGKDWDYNSRKVSLRLTKGLENGTRVEVRLVSSLTNPYLALAAIVAAGADGIRRQLQPPERGEREERVVDTLPLALDALERDDVIIKSFGEAFVDRWLMTKRENEVKPLGHHKVKENIQEELESEIDMYFIL